MYVFDWDLYQWAEAGQRFADANGFLPMPAIAGAILVRDSWERARTDKPTGRAIIFGVEKPLAMAWAARMMLQAGQECPPPSFPRKRCCH